jgi:hypothetical protein
MSLLTFQGVSTVKETMKAILISRPGDFGVLEDHWSADPIFLPLSGGNVLDLHESSLRALGVTEARLLRCHPAGHPTDLAPLEAALQGRSLPWSVRAWPTGPWPTGWTLSEALLRQGLFFQDQDVLIFSAAAADPRGWTGAQVPHGFPTTEANGIVPQKRDRSGRLTRWEGPLISLGGTRDFFRASIRFLETLPPHPVGLRGISRQAVLQAPLSLGLKVKAAAHSHLGPLVHLAAGSRLDPGTSLIRTLVLTPTRFNRDFALEDKIVIGDAVVEPIRGEVVGLP